MTTRRNLLTGATALATIAVAKRAHAQSDLFGKAKGLLDSLSGGSSGGGLSVAEAATGLREALRVGSGNVVEQLSALGGFNLDDAIRIPLPGTLQTVQKTLGRIGLSGMADELQDRMNHAAEVASGKAKPHFLSAIESMTIDDALGIVNGPKDSATRYFQERMTPGLTTEFRPIVDTALAETGAVRAYDNMMGKYQTLPFMPDVKADLANHTVLGGLNGIFHYLAEEEAAIRTNPAARTTDILRKVFG